MIPVFLKVLLLICAAHAGSSISSSNIGSSSVTITTTMVSSTTEAMPSITATSSFSSLASSSSSSYSAIFTPVVPIGKNPFIHMETLPSELVFIIVGIVLGLLFLGLFLTRFIMWYCSSRAAKNSVSLTQASMTEYDPSILQKKHMANHSVYSVSSISTNVGSMSSVDILGSTTCQGRSYRNALTRGSRSSLFISPTELLTMENATYLSWDNSPIESPQTSHAPSNSDPSSCGLGLERDRRAMNNRNTRRPPSVYMEKMLDDDLTDESSAQSFDARADEKVWQMLIWSI